MMLAARDIFLAARRKPRLPYDAEVEWLGSDGRAIILIEDSRVRDVNMGKLRAEVYWSTWKQYGNLFYAEYSGGAPYGTRLLLYANNGNLAYANWRSKSVTVTLTKGVKHVVTYTDSYADIDGAKTTWRGNFSNTSKRITLFSSGPNSYLRDIGARIYSFAVWDRSGNLILDFIPVRFTNELGQSEGAMYDRANPTVGMNPDGSPRTDGLYRNAGTGAFLYGTDKAA